MSALLNDAERASGAWLKIKQHYQKRLERLRADNDSQKLGLEATAMQRGRIAECKAILALDKELPPHEPDNPPDGA